MRTMRTERGPSHSKQTARVCAFRLLRTARLYRQSQYSFGAAMHRAKAPNSEGALVDRATNAALSGRKK